MAMDGVRPQSGKTSSETASTEEQSPLKRTHLTLGEAKAGGESNGQVVPMEVAEEPPDDASGGPRRSKRKRPEDEAQEEVVEKDKKKQIKVERPSPATTSRASGAQEGPASTEAPRVPPAQSSGTAAAVAEAVTATGVQKASPSAGGPPTPAANVKTTMKYARGSLEDLTSEVLRLLQTKGPLSLQDIVDAVPEHLREQQPSVHVVTERVLEGLRVTPLVNLVRPSPDAAALYAFLDGRTTNKPVEFATVGAQLRELGQQERGAKRRIQALKAELARLDGPGVVARPEDAVAALERVLMSDGLPRDAGLSHSSSGSSTHSSSGSLPQPPPPAEAAMGPGQRPALYARAVEAARREAARVRGTGANTSAAPAGTQVKVEGATG